MSDTKAPSAAQVILEEVRETRDAVKTLERLAEIVAVPTETGESFLQMLIDSQSRIVSGIAKLEEGIQALHRAISEPGITSALRRAISED